MKYRNDNDNRYRVNFMRSTEELIDALTVKEFISYLEENAELEDEADVEYIDGKCVTCKVYDLREADSSLHKEFLVTEDERVFYWVSLLKKIELVDREEAVQIKKENNQKAKMVIVFSQIMKGFATKEEVTEEIEELIESETCPYKTLKENIENWARWDLLNEDAIIIFSRLEEYQRYL